MKDICIYNDKQSSFKMLLEKDSYVSIHEKNIRCLTTEMYQINNGLSPSVVTYIYTKILLPLTTATFQFFRPLVRSVFYGTESITYFGPVIWDILPDNYKNLPNLSAFKSRIKKREPENCPCRLWKTCISRLCFAQKFVLVSWMKLWHISHSCLFLKIFNFCDYA